MSDPPFWCLCEDVSTDIGPRGRGKIMKGKDPSSKWEERKAGSAHSAAHLAAAAATTAMNVRIRFFQLSA